MPPVRGPNWKAKGRGKRASPSDGRRPEPQTNLRKMRRVTQMVMNPKLDEDINSADFNYHKNGGETSNVGTQLVKPQDVVNQNRDENITTALTVKRVTNGVTKSGCSVGEGEKATQRISTKNVKSARKSVKRAIEGDGSDGEPILDAYVSTEDAKSARISVKRAIEGDGSDGEPILDANVGKGLKRRPKRSGTGRSYKLKGTSDFGSTAVEESETDCLAGTKSTECTEDIQSSELVLGDKSGLNHIQGLSIVKNRQKENNGNESDEHEIPLLNTGMALSVMKKRNRDERERESIKNESDLPGNGRTASDFLGEARCSGSNTLPVDIGRRNEHMLQSSLDDVRTRSWKDAGDVDQRDEPSLTRTQQSAKTSEMSSVQRLEGSIAVLSKQIRNMETTLLKSVNESRKENKRDILQVQTKLHDMNSDLNSLKALVAVGGDGSKRKGNAGKNTPVVMFFAEAFNTTVIRRVFERSVVKHIVDVSQGRGVDQYARAMSFAFNVLMFAVTPRAGETKEKYKSNTGQCFSLFRRGIVLSALLVAQRNTFSIFDNPDSVVCGKVFGNVKKPEWLREGFVQYSHINRARDLQEEIGTRKKASARGKEKKGQSMRVSNGTPLMQDTDDHNHVQNHVGIILYREIIDRLHDSRFHSK